MRDGDFENQNMVSRRGTIGAEKDLGLSRRGTIGLKSGWDSPDAGGAELKKKTLGKPRRGDKITGRGALGYAASLAKKPCFFVVYRG